MVEFISKNGLAELKNLTQGISGFILVPTVLQILDIDRGHKKYDKITLSDGVYKYDLFKSCKNKIPIQIYDIIKIEKAAIICDNQNNGRKGWIIKIEKIVNQPFGIIGDPSEYVWRDDEGEEGVGVEGVEGVEGETKNQQENDTMNINNIHDNNVSFSDLLKSQSQTLTNFNNISRASFDKSNITRINLKNFRIDNDASFNENNEVNQPYLISNNEDINNSTISHYIKTEDNDHEVPSEQISNKIRVNSENLSSNVDVDLSKESPSKYTYNIFEEFKRSKSRSPSPRISLQENSKKDDFKNGEISKFSHSPKNKESSNILISKFQILAMNRNMIRPETQVINHYDNLSSMIDLEEKENIQEINQNENSINSNLVEENNLNDNNMKKQEHIFSIYELSTLLTKFTIKIRVINISITHFNTVYILVKDSNNFYSNIYLDTRHFEKYLPKFKLNKIYKFSNGLIESSQDRTAKSELIRYKIYVRKTSIIKELPEQEGADILSEIIQSLIKLNQIDSAYGKFKYYINVLVYVIKVNDDSMNTYHPKSIEVIDDSFHKICIKIPKFVFEKFLNKIKEHEILLITNCLIYLEDKKLTLRINNRSYIENVNDYDLSEVGQLKQICSGIERNDLINPQTQNVALKHTHIRDLSRIINYYNHLFSNNDRRLYYPDPLLFPHEILIKASIVTLDKDITDVYFGCPICRRGDVQLDKSTLLFFCDECKETVNSKVYYCKRLRVRDASGEITLILFDEEAMKLFKMTSKQYEKFLFGKNENEQKIIDEINSRLEYKSFYFLLKIDYQNTLKYNTFVVLNFFEDIHINRNMYNLASELRSILNSNL
jgi:hypothetical protein